MAIVLASSSLGLVLWGAALAFLLNSFELSTRHPYGVEIWRGIAAAAGALILAPPTWLWVRPLYLRSLFKGLLALMAAIACAALAGFALADEIAADSIRARERALQTAWFKEHHDFENAPDGFPLLQKLAHDDYGLELILGRLSDSYLSTTRPWTGGSIGIMTVLSGYCQMSLWPTGIRRIYAPLPGDQALGENQIVVATAAHEVGHCIDMSRDQASFKDPHVGIASIPPSERSGVMDVHGVNNAETYLATTLWREVYADLFSVGYTKLSWSGTDASTFYRLLLETRERLANADPGHHTSCWLRAVKDAPAPTNTKSIGEWADHYRTTANCSLPAPSVLDRGNFPLP